MRHTRITVTHYGGPDALQVIEEDCPPGEMRVKVLAAGVSLPDVVAREGVHPKTPRVPYAPGWDLVGIVDQVGESVSGFEVGQTVAAMPGRKSMVPYSIRWLMRLKPTWFRDDLRTLFDPLKQKKIKPLIAQRLPLCQARHAHELPGSGGVIGKIALIPNG